MTLCGVLGVDRARGKGGGEGNVPRTHRHQVSQLIRFGRGLHSLLTQGPRGLRNQSVTRGPTVGTGLVQRWAFPNVVVSRETKWQLGIRLRITGPVFFVNDVPLNSEE